MGSYPVTGDDLDSGDLSKLVQDGGIESGLVTEVLLVNVQNRAGDILAAYLPYHYVGGKHLP